uniref:Uncharacterized protein AlNc14C195G8543 n=1 Tax=Albugo laibachii Nc14 TaxID=890382 RepID=F0WQ62_9STRA|nr:conserved hypothetical protein [Albugo laibachii Nc14]|eukprot:CCA23468.1 conserved hypothetical protein [Albugo laibachii Nc14]
MKKDASLQEIFDQKIDIPLNRRIERKSLFYQPPGNSDTKLKHPRIQFEELEKLSFEVEPPHRSDNKALPDNTITPSRTALVPPIQSSLSGKDRKPRNELVSLNRGEIDPLGVINDIERSDEDRDTSDKKHHISSEFSEKLRPLHQDLNSRGLIEPSFLDEWKRNADPILSSTHKLPYRIRPYMMALSKADHPGELSLSKLAVLTDTNSQKGGESVPVIKRAKDRLHFLDTKMIASNPTQYTSLSESMSELNELVELSQAEYIAKISTMKEQLVQTWQRKQKVEALRVTIKAVKILKDADTSPELYPSAFVLVSTILNKFGQLVFDRIRERACSDEFGQTLTSSSLPEDFSSAQINVQAKETCRNWFYKTACIRELLPRIYIEVALLQCYRFLSNGEFELIILRLSNMIRGIADPLVAVYARLYLTLSASTLMRAYTKNVIMASLSDYFISLRHFRTHQLSKWTEKHHPTMNPESKAFDSWTEEKLLALHSPAIKWLLRYAALVPRDQNVFDDLLAQYKETCGNSMVLKHLIDAFGAEIASDKICREICHLIRASSQSNFTKSHLYAMVAQQLAKKEPHFIDHKCLLYFLNTTWKSISEVVKIEEYMECGAAYMQLIVTHFSPLEAQILLKDISRKLDKISPMELNDTFYNQLGAIIEHVVCKARKQKEYFVVVIPSLEFLTLLGLLKQDTSVSVSKKVLHAFVGSNSSLTKPSSDKAQFRLHVAGPQAAVARTLFVLCCRIHDSLDNLSTQTQLYEASTDICKFIMRLGVLNDTSLCGNTSARNNVTVDEKGALLQLYTDCRRAFYKLEPVKATLSKCVLILTTHVARPCSMERKKITTKLAGRQDSEFIKSCLAHAFVTIPSISTFLEPKLDIYKFGLYTFGANVALRQNSLSQLDGFLKSAIRQIAETNVSMLLEDAKEHYRHLMNFVKIPVASDDAFQGRSYFQSHDAFLDGGFLHYVRCLVSIIAYTPSVKDDDPFYYVSAMYNLLFDRIFPVDCVKSESDDKNVHASSRTQSRAWSFESKFMVEVLRVHFKLLFTQLFGLWGQRQLTNKIDGVDSNNVLYDGDVKFVSTTQAHFSDCVRQIIIDLELWTTNSSRDKDTADSVVVKLHQIMDCIILITPFLTWEVSSRSGPKDNVVLSASLTLRMFQILSKQWQALQSIKCPSSLARIRESPAEFDPTSQLMAFEDAVLTQVQHLLADGRSQPDAHQDNKVEVGDTEFSLLEKRAIVMQRLETLMVKCGQ